MNANGKNESVLAEVLGRMERRMRLANYAESTIVSYCRSARLLGSKLGKSPEGIEEDETWQQLLLRKTGFDIAACPCCQKGRMQPRKGIAKGRSPPTNDTPQSPPAAA